MVNIIKGQIIAPVGSGKTRMEYICVEESFKNNASICLVVAPRISLLHQIVEEFYYYRNEQWKSLCVCSSQAELKEWYEDEDVDTSIETTTNEFDIQNAIKNSEKIVIFSTLHSCWKVSNSLNEIDKKADLMIFDEAHNVTNEEWFEYVKEDFPCKRQLFFTATRKVSNFSNGRGMNNEIFFGPVLYNVEPVELMEKGIIVPPRLHFIRPKEIKIDDTNITMQVSLIVSAAKKHQEIYPDEARIIVFCENTSQAHDIAESETIKKCLPDWNIEAITSLPHRQQRKRQLVFDDFLKSKKSILLHYDIVSEGVNLPGATAILPLRHLGEIKTNQGIGRVLRLNDEDRKNLNSGIITVDEKNKWKKPYGYVILPIIGMDYEIASEKVSSIVRNLRQHGFNFDVEQISYIDDPEGCEKEKPVFDNGDPKYKEKKVFKGTLKDLEKIEKKITHEIEEELTINEFNNMEGKLF